MVGLCLACVTFLLYQGWTTGDLYGNLVYSNNYRKQLFPTWDRPSEKFKLNIQTYPGALVDFAETKEKNIFNMYVVTQLDGPTVDMGSIC